MQGQILNIGGSVLRKKGNAERKVYNTAHTQPTLWQNRSGKQSTGTNCNSICWCKERNDLISSWKHWFKKEQDCCLRDINEHGKWTFFFSFQKLVLLLLFCCEHFIRLEGGPVCALLQVCSLSFLALFQQRQSRWVKVPCSKQHLRKRISNELSCLIAKE